MNQVISMAPMRETMAELTKTAALLNEASDQLNEVIKDFEQGLEDAGVGVTAWLTDLIEGSGITKEGEGQWSTETRTGWRLGYTKVDNKWRVAARFVRVESTSESSTDFEERAPVALDKAPRLVRVAAAPLLEPLALALIERMGEYLDGIAQAKSQAKHGSVK